MGRNRRLSLSEFEAFLDQQLRAAQKCYQEVDTVRQRLTEAFSVEMEGWQAVFAVCLPQLEARRAEMPPGLASTIDRVEEEERQSLRDEIATLEQQIAEGKARSDELLAAAQAETRRLSEANPLLNDQEEALKSQAVRYEDEYARAYEEEEALQAAALGWLTHAPQIYRLRRQQRDAKRRQEQVLSKVRALRQQWTDDVKNAGDRQGTLREEWQAVQVRMAEQQTRRAHLQENLDALALQNALRRVLMELQEPPDVPGDLGAQLADLARRNAIRTAYEEALQVTAEFLGRTKGVSSGLDKFTNSVSGVVREQRRYNLRNVPVQVPQPALQVFGALADVVQQFADPEPWASNPKRVTGLLGAYNRTHLSDESIKALFETMGDELTRATSAWN